MENSDDSTPSKHSLWQLIVATKEPRVNERVGGRGCWKPGMEAQWKYLFENETDFKHVWMNKFASSLDLTRTGLN